MSVVSNKNISNDANGLEKLGVDMRKVAKGEELSTEDAKKAKDATIFIQHLKEYGQMTEQEKANRNRELANMSEEDIAKEKDRLFEEGKKTVIEADRKNREFAGRKLEIDGREDAKKKEAAQQMRNTSTFKKLEEFNKKVEENPITKKQKMEKSNQQLKNLFDHANKNIQQNADAKGLNDNQVQNEQALDK